MTATLQGTCADCAQTIHNPADSCGTGYAKLPDGRKICYACADKRQREELRDRSKPFCAYVASHGRTITTWTGGVLMLITRSNRCRLTRLSHTHGKFIQCIHARDVHGGHWFGRGSPGIAIKLRACKG